MVLKENNLFLLGDGYTDNGQFPFLDQYNINTMDKKRIYESNFTDKKESLREFMAENNEILVRIESPEDYHNYYLRTTKNSLFPLRRRGFFLEE